MKMAKRNPLPPLAKGGVGDLKAIFQVILGLEGKENGREGEGIDS